MSWNYLMVGILAMAFIGCASKTNSSVEIAQSCSDSSFFCEQAFDSATGTFAPRKHPVCQWVDKKCSCYCSE